MVPNGINNCYIIVNKEQGLKSGDSEGWVKQVTSLKKNE